MGLVCGNPERQKDMRFTFSQISYPLTIDRGSMLINVSHQELAEMSNDRSADAVVRDPFHDRLGFNVTHLVVPTVSPKNLPLRPVKSKRR